MMNFCGDCGVREGEIHEEGCDMERCPKCHRQFLTCGCDITNWEREPYFWKGFSCARCGKIMPNLIMVSNDEWKQICCATYDLEDVLCVDCMKFIAEKRGIEIDKFKEIIFNG